VRREVWSAFGDLTMHRTSRLLHSLHEDASADAVLGPDHPLVRVRQRLRARVEQSLVVAAMLSASIVALLDGVSAALPFVAAAAIVEAVLATGAAMLCSSRREHVLDLIIQGRGEVPIRAVVRQRRRLLGPGHRLRLARWLDAMRRDAERPIRDPRAGPIFSVRVIAAVAPDLTMVARSLRGTDAGLRGITATERLLTDGTSVLYRNDEELLREELRRIRYLLEECATRPLPAFSRSIEGRAPRSSRATQDRPPRGQPRP
jgi:hypothetical protein